MNLTSLMAAGVGETLVFWICGGLAVVGALGMVLSPKAVHAALFVGMTMINLAVIYVSLEAPFLGMVQIIVYTGAVMMLFLFVMMVVGVDSSDSLIETIRGQRWMAVIFSLGLGALLIGLIGNGLAGSTPGSVAAADAVHGGNVEGLASLIFTRYFLAFEVTSALLITAALGAMILAHRDRHTARPTQESLSRERFRSGVHPGVLPASGSYARHNAVDTPALLPDATPEPLSVPSALRARHQAKAVPMADIDEVTTLATGGTVAQVDAAQSGDPHDPDRDTGGDL
ncbi:MAG: NADH-quinone oxidoreductase subunit J [Candidatus Nanopelagicales bacterium]|nr:NADH-quinone oxidoreductase subunit J [Candidatus Nanopelagicales bacterium]